MPSYVVQLEMDAVENNRTWELADLPHGHRAITLKWVFKLKRDEAGAIVNLSEPASKEQRIIPANYLN